MRNAGNTAFTSQISGISLPDEFGLLTDVYLSWGAGGNTAGVLSNYLGPGDFYEVRLNAQGTAWLSQVRGGTRFLIDTRSYPGGGIRRWSTVFVQRAAIQGIVLQIEINGQQVFNVEFEFDHPSVREGGSAGVFASWNLARFDNVRIGERLPYVPTVLTGFETLGFLEFFSPQSGTWTVENTAENGYARSSTNQASSIATSGLISNLSGYGISATHAPGVVRSRQLGRPVYDYVDSRNYREVRLSLSRPGRQGMLILAEVVHGVRREVFRTPRLESSTTSRELFVTLKRDHDRTIVSELSALSNVQVRQAPPAVPVRVGLLAAWNLVRFDDVALFDNTLH